MCTVFGYSLSFTSILADSECLKGQMNMDLDKIPDSLNNNELRDDIDQE